MKRTGAQQRSSWRASIGRMAAAAMAVGVLSAVAAQGVATAATSATTASSISTTKNSKLGMVLTSGTTVYALKAGKTACTAECMKVWHPVLLPSGVTAPTAGDGVDASKLGTVPAAGGALQVTYNGKPLYWFAKDTAPGQVKGNTTNKWGKWAAVVTAKASSGSKSNAGTGGAGF